MNTKENLMVDIKKLIDHKLPIKSINYVKVDPNSQLPFDGDDIIAAGTYPNVESQAGNTPWLSYESKAHRKISRTALLGTGHYATADSPCEFRELKCRNTYAEAQDTLWDFQTLEVGATTFVVPVPKCDIKITFGDAGAVFVPAAYNGSQITSFKSKDHYATLSVSKA